MKEQRAREIGFKFGRLWGCVFIFLWAVPWFVGVWDLVGKFFSHVEWH